jgi:hypothetical protein
MWVWSGYDVGTLWISRVSTIDETGFKQYLGGIKKNQLWLAIKKVQWVHFTEGWGQ